MRRCRTSFGERWTLRERAVRPMLVVVLDVDPEHALKMSAPENEDPVEALAPTLLTQRSACAFAFGAPTGVRMTTKARMTSSVACSELRQATYPGARMRKGRPDRGTGFSHPTRLIPTTIRKKPSKAAAAYWQSLIVRPQIPIAPAAMGAGGTSDE